MRKQTETEKKTELNKWKKTNLPGPSTYSSKPYVSAKEEKSKSYSFLKKARVTYAQEVSKAKDNIPAPSHYTVNFC